MMLRSGTLHRVCARLNSKTPIIYPACGPAEQWPVACNHCTPGWRVGVRHIHVRKTQCAPTKINPANKQNQLHERKLE